MNTQAARKRVLVFLAITFGISWTLLIAGGIATGSFEAGESASPVMLGMLVLTMFTPLVGALLANAIVGKDARIDLALRPRIKGNVKHYLLAWFGPAVVVVAGTAVFFTAFPSWFDPRAGSLATSQLAADAGQVTEGRAPLVAAATVASAVLVAPLINMVPAFGEEAGWRGMLFPSLCERFSPRDAAVVSGIIWGVWHAPAICMGHNYGMAYPGFPVAGILVMVLLCTAFGACLCRLRMRSESVWPCALAHGAFNAVANIGIVLCAVDPTPLGPSPLGLVAGIPVIFLGLWCLVRLRDLPAQS